MELAIDVRTEHPHAELPVHALKYRRRITILLIGLACFVAATVAQAQASAGFSASAEEAIPWSIDDLADPFAVAAATPYVIDPGVHGGEYIEDAFGANQGSATNYFLGRKVAQLPGGDVVVAALVKNPNGNQTNGFWNVGLVRYSANGNTRRTWANPGSYGSSANQYVVYPKTDTATYTWVQDIKIVNSFILVSTNHDFNQTGGDSDVQILVFDLNGQYKSTYVPFGTSDREYIGGMEGYSSGSPASTYSIVVAATVVPVAGGVPRPIFRRMTLGSTGSLSDVTGKVPLNVAGCANTADDCEVKAIALAYPPLFINGTPSVFIAAVRRAGSTSAEANISVLKVSVSGVADASWSSTTWNTSPGGNRADIPFGIGVRTSGLGLPASPTVYTVYVASYIDRQCKPGISILRQSTQDNGATAVTVRYGGSDSTDPAICALFASSDYGAGVAMQDGRFAVVGYNSAPVLGAGEDRVNAEMAVFDDLNLISFSQYPYPTHGPRERHSGFWGVVGTGSGKFVAAGDNRFRDASDVSVNLRGKNSVAVLGLMEDDTIFANSFEQP